MIAVRSRLVRLIELAALSTVLALAATQAYANDNADLIAGIAIVGLIATLLYLIPTIVAFWRSHPNRWLIAVINVTLGGTGIGWLGSLVWACSAAHLSAKGSNGGESGLNLFVNDTKQVKIEPTAPLLNFDEISAQLLRLKRLRDAGAITVEEYDELRRPFVQAL